MGRQLAKEYVEALIEAGSVSAIGMNAYVIIDQIYPGDSEAQNRIEALARRFRDVRQLKPFIIFYLHEIGRCSEAHHPSSIKGRAE